MHHIEECTRWWFQLCANEVSSRVTVKFEMSPSLDNLFSGLSDWKNIQDVVRLSFKAMHELIKEQGNTIDNLKNQLDSAPTRNDVSSNVSVVVHIM